ncbi:MAG TPA: hypothetical protein VF188_00975 [Longimicrobiales bacterium]
MSAGHFKALLGLELRRLAPTVLRVQGAALVLAALFILLGKASTENLLAAFIGTPIGATLLAPMTIVRDKMERTLEFLCTLPATAGEIAAARFAAAALALAPGAALAGIAVAAVDLPTPFDVLHGGLLAAATVGFWLLLSIASWVLVAAAAAFEFARLLRWPLVVVALAVILLLRIAERVRPADVAVALRDGPIPPWALPAAASVLLVALAAAALFAFAITRRAVARYRPDLDQPL